MTPPHRTGDPEHAREINRALVLNAFRSRQKTSRAELVRHLDLSKVTVSSVVNALVREHLLVERGEGASQSSGGRKPIMLSLDAERRRVVGIDIGATTINGALSDLGGNVIARCHRATPGSRGVRGVVSCVRSIVEEVRKRGGVERGSILGVGVSAAGIVESSSGTVRFSPDFNWKHVPLGELIGNAVDLSVVVDNCTRAMALGEQWFGNARGLRNAFYVNVGYGVGSAVIFNNQVYDNHSEFGHLFVTRSGVKCYCGKTGCLEAVSSGHAIERRANQALKQRRGERITARELAQRASSGDREARAIFDAAGKYLGRAIAMVANLLNPGRIIIGGGVSLAGSTLLDPVRSEFEMHTMDVIRAGTVVETSALGMNAALFGAVSLALNCFVFHPEHLHG